MRSFSLYLGMLQGLLVIRKMYQYSEFQLVRLLRAEAREARASARAMTKRRKMPAAPVASGLARVAMENIFPELQASYSRQAV